MTYKEKIIATAYTGIMFVDGVNIGDVYAYEEEKLSHGVIDIMHADKEFCMKVRKACKEDFLEMLEGKYEEGWRAITEKERIVLQKALNEYGITSQKWMLVEECSELLNAIAKLNRGRVGVDDIITELADVSIMVDQMAIIFGEEKIKAERERKIDRLEQRLRKCTLETKGDAK